MLSRLSYAAVIAQSFGFDKTPSIRDLASLPPSPIWLLHPFLSVVADQWLVILYIKCNIKKCMWISIRTQFRIRHKLHMSRQIKSVLTTHLWCIEFPNVADHCRGQETITYQLWREMGKDWSSKAENDEGNRLFIGTFNCLRFVDQDMCTN